MNTIKKYLIWTAVSVLLPLMAANCSSDDDIATYSSSPSVAFSIPAKIDILAGGEYTFTVKNAVVPTTSDYFMLEASNGVLYLSPIVGVTDDTFTVK